MLSQLSSKPQTLFPSPSSLMASLNRSIPLSRAFRALSFHPPIPPAPHLPASASKRLHLRTISSSTARSLPPRRPKYPDTLPYNQHLYSIGYPQDSLDDLSPPLANVDIMSLPNPLTLIAVGGSANYASMTNESIVYICNRSVYASGFDRLKVGLRPPLSLPRC